MKRVCLLFCLFFALHAQAQEGEEYTVNADSMNAAIDLVTEANQLFEQGNHARAINLCDEAIRKAVTFRDAYVIRHKAYEAGGSSTQLIIDNLLAAQKISLEDEELAYYLANTYQNTKRLKEAAEQYTHAINYSSTDPAVSPIRYSYFFNRANCYLKQRQYAKAIPDYTQTLELNPDYVGALVNRGFSYYNTKEKDKACADWKKAQSLGNKQVGQYMKQYCN